MDDDVQIRNMLVEALTLEGYPTETASNGQDALQTLMKSGSRVVLLDLLMPVMNGREMMEALQANPAERRRHKIVLVSALHNLESHRDLEADGQLPKPFTVPQLLNTIDAMSREL